MIRMVNRRFYSNLHSRLVALDNSVNAAQPRVQTHSAAAFHTFPSSSCGRAPLQNFVDFYLTNFGRIFRL